MTTAASSQETRHSSAFALLSVMLREIFALMLNPARTAEADARMAEMELETARSLLAHALSLNPEAGLTVDDFEIVRLYNARGDFDPDFQPKPHVIAARQADRRTFLLQLRHVRLARLYLARAATFRGTLGRLRSNAGVSSIHRRCAALRACARIAERAGLRAPIPP